MSLPPNTQTHAYQDILHQRAIRSMYLEVKKWMVDTGMNVAMLRTEDILVKLSSYFVERMRSGDVLFVGEGNLSFALGVASMPHVNPAKITASTYQDERAIGGATRENAQALTLMGASVIHGVDATNLEKAFPYRQFDTIVFQFPNTGNRVPVEGRNPNFILVRDFLKSAALLAGFKMPSVYPFDPAKLSGYSHTNTNDEDSAIIGHDTFRTWVFSLKGNSF